LDPPQPQVGPGVPQVGSNAPRSSASSAKAGSVLFFHKYTSDTTRSNEVNTLITLTNTNPRDSVIVRVFFIHDGVFEDQFITLVANQSRTFVAGKESPNMTGYVMAVAVNSQGLPSQFNWLIGGASLRDDQGHEASYNAFAVAKRAGGPINYNDGGQSSSVKFDDKDYDRLPKVVAGVTHAGPGTNGPRQPARAPRQPQGRGAPDRGPLPRQARRPAREACPPPQPSESGSVVRAGSDNRRRALFSDG